MATLAAIFARTCGLPGRLACFSLCKYRDFLNELQILPSIFVNFLKVEFSLKIFK